MLVMIYAHVWDALDIVDRLIIYGLQWQQEWPHSVVRDPDDEDEEFRLVVCDLGVCFAQFKGYFQKSHHNRSPVLPR